jgi:acyl carrier protein
VNNNHRDTAINKAQLTAWITDWMTRELKLSAAPADLGKPFVSYGMDSVHAMMLVGDLEDLLGRRLPPTLAWDHPTVGALAAHLAQDSVPRAARPSLTNDSEILNRLDSLSEEEIDRLLRERLGNTQGT